MAIETIECLAGQRQETMWTYLIVAIKDEHRRRGNGNPDSQPLARPSKILPRHDDDNLGGMKIV